MSMQSSWLYEREGSSKESTPYLFKYMTQIEPGRALSARRWVKVRYTAEVLLEKKISFMLDI
jgi:hypothetical protein